MFTPNSGAGEGRSLIPDKTVAFAQVRFQEIKKSQKTGGEYARLEFTIVDGPFEGRKVFSIVMNPKDPSNGDVKAPTPNGAKMGLTALTRMLEACRIFDAAKPESYHRFDTASFGDILAELDTQTVAIKVKVVPPKDGYDEKNEISEYASPNPLSGSIRLWEQLTGGAPAAQQARSSAFGAAPVQAPASQPKAGGNPTWLKSPGNAPF